MRTCPREAGPQAPGWAGERERHMAMSVGAGEVNMLQSLFSLQLPLTHTTLSNKGRGIFFKKSSLVFIIASICILQEFAYDNTTHPQSCFSSHFFFFFGYFRCADPRVISIASFSALFYVVFESLHRCVNTVFNADKSSSSLFFLTRLSKLSLGCKALYRVISFLVLWSICVCSSLVHFKISPEYPMRGTLIRFL